jgi:hypothetical protein
MGLRRKFNQNDYNYGRSKIEVHMAVWQVQGAKTRLSEVIEEANSKGPQSAGYQHPIRDAQETG